MNLDERIGVIRAKYAGLQTSANLYARELAAIGSDGCLFLCLCSIAEEFQAEFGEGGGVDVLSAFVDARRGGCIDAECYVLDSPKLLELLTGARWSRRVVKSLSLPLKGREYTVEKHFNKKTGFTHFKRRPFDTLVSSVTVRDGVLVEYYVYEAL